MATSTLSSNTQTRPALPPSYVPIMRILQEQLPPQTVVSVIGLVRDYRPPIPTSGKDHKCSVRLLDYSTEEEDRDIVVNIFRPESKMPEIGFGDVLVVNRAKVQRYGSSDTSLISYYSTTFSAYQGSLIPNPPGSAARALRQPIGRQGAEGLNLYVSTFYHSINKDTLPSQAEVVERSASSLKAVREKYATLSDVADGYFYDLVVQVVKEPYDLGDRTTIWAADYTENAHFYNYPDPDSTATQYGDPHGYLSKHTMPALSESAGPFGKRAIQITCYEPHASAVRARVRLESWLTLRNVQVKFGNNGSNLEGFLREDRQYPTRIGVDVFDMTNIDVLNPRLKEALKRKRAYYSGRKKQLDQAKDDDEKSNKRKPTNEPTAEQLTSKKRRKMEREARFKAREAVVDPTDLNPDVSCENMAQPITTLSSFLQPLYYKTTVDGQSVEIEVPFNNSKCRAICRVIGFSPPKIEDFAVSRRFSEYDAIRDQVSSDDDSYSDSEESQDDKGTLKRWRGKRIWEWKFSLLLEDASPQAASKRKKDAVWVVVDNNSAQLLTGRTASDLRADDGQALSYLQQQLGRLWGNLGEIKAKELAAKQKQERKKTNVRARSGFRQSPPPASSDVESNQKSPTSTVPSTELSSKNFPCCLQQYGVKVPEPDESKASAGQGMRWKRVVGMFGVKLPYFPRGDDDMSDD